MSNKPDTASSSPDRPRESEVQPDDATLTRPPEAAVRRKSVLGRWLAYLFAALALIWVLHDIHPQRALSEVTAVRWSWVALGIFLDVLSYVAQGLRWKLLLKPLGRVRLRQSVRAIFAGLFANDLLPLRSGELLRAYLLSRAEGIGFAGVLTSIGVERVIDAAVLASGIAILSFYVRVPARFERIAEGLGAFVLLLVILAAVGLYFYARRPVTRPGSGFQARLHSVVEGLRQMSHWPSFKVALSASLLTPLLQAVALWAFLRSYGLALSLLPAAVVLFVINLGVAVPNAPANIGSYQFFCVLGLSLFGVEKTTAAGFSIFVFLVLTIPFLLLGFLAVTRSGLSITTLRRDIASLLSERLQNSSRA